MTPVEAWLSALVCMAAAFRRPENDPADLAALTKDLLIEAKPILKQLNANRLAIDNLVALIRLGRAPSEKVEGAPSPRYESQLLIVVGSMKRQLTPFWLSNAISESQVKVGRAAFAVLNYNKETIAKKEAALDVSLHVIPDPDVRALFSVTKVASQDKTVAELKHLVKTWTGRSDHSLSVDESKKTKEKDPERYARYLALRRDAADSWKSFVRNYVREKGGDPQPIKQILPELDKAGITFHPLKALYPMRIGEDLKLYTRKNHVLDAFPPLGSQIIFNPNFQDDLQADGDWIFQFKVPNSKADGMAYAYTQQRLKSNKAAVFEKVAKAITVVPKRRSKWVADLNSKQPNKFVLGAMTELLYSEAMRIGGQGKTDGETTYGLSTLLVKHVSYLPVSKGYTLKYPGKKGVSQKHIIKPAMSPEYARVCQVIGIEIRGKKNADRLWTIQGYPVTAADVNAYFKKQGLGITPHKMRHVQGTTLMSELLGKARVPKGSNQSAVEKIVKGLAVNVGALLGHIAGDKITPATAIKSYIDPSVIAQFFTDRNLRVPAWVPMLGGDAKADA